MTTGQIIGLLILAMMAVAVILELAIQWWENRK